MSSLINPFSFQAILVKPTQCLLLVPENLEKKSPPLQQNHLHNLVCKVREATLKKYSLMSTLHSSTIMSEPLSSIKNLTMLVEQLHVWMQQHKNVLKNSFGGPFCEKISQALDISTPSSSLDLCNTPAIKQHPPKKRWQLQHAEEEFSPLLKKAKKSIEESSSIISPESFLKTEGYLVQEIVMLQDSVFTFTTRKVPLIEDWVMSSHQQIGNIITNSHLVFVDSSQDISALQHKTAHNLRRSTLKALLPFMTQIHDLTKNIKDPDLRKETFSSHITLLEDIHVSLKEIKEKSIAILPINSPKVPIISPKNKIRKYKLVPKENFFINVRSLAHRFLLSPKASMQHSNKYKHFLKIVEKASLSDSYNSSNNLPDIIRTVSKDKKLALTALYYVTHRNLYCFTMAFPFFARLKLLQQLTQETLNLLNKKYCEAINHEADPLNHNKDLLVSLVSPTNPPKPIQKIKQMSFISVFPCSVNKNSFYTKITSIVTPIKTSYGQLKYWLLSLKKHQQRLAFIIALAKKNPIYLTCKNDSWKLEHNVTNTISLNDLLATLTAISQHNLNTCMLQFRDGIDDINKKILLPGHEKTEKILSSIIKMCEHADNISTPILEKIRPTKNCKNTSSIPLMQLLSIFRPGTGYTLSIHSVSIQIKMDNISTCLSHAKKILYHIKNIFQDSTFPKIEYNHQVILDPCVFIPLVYWGIKYNIACLKLRCKETFFTTKTQTSKKQYTQALTFFDKLQDELLKEWHTRTSLTTPISPLSEISHPLQNTLSILFQKLES
ncbi:hypothetical protein CLAVI_000905 [Candidatus Clavichlamydia salmonicola]|uniref:hypothetical protein n=1 Tax=Candidatus Clavichlamydia salmonicola TaxID=469812 RepID=UPI001890E709|nr:hypothetical protein [Candidatus Clavichlamydia salmonicola]MBF5051264.1 hypothetical protein [Candidatus Clavichlamydia salmonicola]